MGAAIAVYQLAQVDPALARSRQLCCDQPASVRRTSIARANLRGAQRNGVDLDGSYSLFDTIATAGTKSKAEGRADPGNRVYFARLPH